MIFLEFNKIYFLSCVASGQIRWLVGFWLACFIRWSRAYPKNHRISDRTCREGFYDKKLWAKKRKTKRRETCGYKNYIISFECSWMNPPQSHHPLSKNSSSRGFGIVAGHLMSFVALVSCGSFVICKVLLRRVFWQMPIRYFCGTSCGSFSSVLFIGYAMFEDHLTFLKQFLPLSVHSVEEEWLWILASAV